MAEIAKSGNPSLATLLPGNEHRTVKGLAGEDLAPWDACYVRNDGRIMRASGAAANAAARVRGFAPDDGCPSGEAVTLLDNVTVRYGTGLTPGADVYLSATVPGGLSDTATTGGTASLGYVLPDGKRIKFHGTR